MSGCNNQFSRCKPSRTRSQTLSDVNGMKRIAQKSPKPVKRGCGPAVPGMWVTSEGKVRGWWEVVVGGSWGRRAGFEGGPSVANERGLYCHQEEAGQ